MFMKEQENGTSSPLDLVVVGSSAGGVEALSILVSTLPSNFPAPIVLAQHLDPTRPSTLDIIFQRRSMLPVEKVITSAALERGKIYVVPSNRHIAISDHRVEVLEDRGKRPRPSVDVLLSTAAASYGERLIAVILTGSGSDGAAGAVDVKNAGGTVIVQDPQTARYPSMPMALPPTVIDFEEKIEHIGSLLYDLLNGVAITQTEEKTEDVLRSILERVSHQANIDFRPYKTSTILRRIGRRMTVTHSRSIHDYAEYLKENPEEIGELVKAFLINVTQFFRDPEAFTYLRREVLPLLIARAHERDRTLRFWTAGCATGEEPYSLAMLLTDMLGSELPTWSIKIFATDLDEPAINFARRGLYSENLLKGIPNEYVERFFERVDQGFRILKTLRQMVIFGQQDLSHSAPFPRIDMVLCRNVLIYFTPELQEYVLNQFAFSLSPGGYLFLGKAETVRPTQQHYELVNKHWKVYRCVGNVLPSVRRQNPPNLSMLPIEGRVMNRQNKNTGKLPGEQVSPQLPVELGQLRRFNELLLRFLPIGVVVIDRFYHIITANGTARRLLGLHDMGIDQDFLHAVHGIPYPMARNAIDTVFREHNVMSLSEIELDVESGGNGRFINISIALMQIEASTQEYAAISVTDVTEQVQTRRQVETVQAEQAQLMNELGAANKRFSDMNKELMDANEELQVANEELMLTHEELQASIEEFETTNEELQATNEELETNNEELQATNEELETTNEELRARTLELQETASILDSERVRLSEIVELAPLHILVLRGSSLTIEAYNPKHTPGVEGRSIQGRPLDEVPELFGDVQIGIAITRLAFEVYQLDEMRTSSRMVLHDRVDGRERYFVYTFVPSHDITGRVDGVIIYVLDETEQRIRTAEQERERLRIIFDNMPLTLLALYDATTAELVLASSNYLALLEQENGRRFTNVRQHKWHDVAPVTSPEQAASMWDSVLKNDTSVRLPEVHSMLSNSIQETMWNYSLTPIMDVQRPDVVRYVLVSALNITEQVMARVELERLDALKDEFLSLTTHELRSPLTAIQGNVQTMQRLLSRQLEGLDGDSSQGAQGTQRQLVERWSDTLLRVSQQAVRMNQLVEEMLDASRLQSGMFRLHNQEHVNIVALVQQIIDQQPEEARADHEIRLHVDVDEAKAIGTLDPHRVEQVLQNLLTNAYKYSDAGTPVDVMIQQSPSLNGIVVISVRDEGEGISEEDQAHIFERFYRTSTRNVDGLGLGLYIASRIIEQYGGRMWVESTPDQGSTFSFSLPLNS